MTTVVVDSGFLLATVLEEDFTLAARLAIASWGGSNFTFAAPHLFVYEIVATIRKSVVRGRIAPEDSEDVIESLLAIPLELHFSQSLLRRGFEIAGLLNRPTAYDSQYLAVAEHLNCEFWTVDERLYNAAHQTFSWVRWVGETNPRIEK